MFYFTLHVTTVLLCYHIEQNDVIAHVTIELAMWFSIGDQFDLTVYLTQFPIYGTSKIMGS